MPPLLMTMLFSLLLNFLAPQPVHGLPHIAGVADRAAVMAAEWHSR